VSVVIVGGHDRMVKQYSDVCRECGCRAKIYTQPAKNLDGLIGNPDLIVLITNPVSHEMAKTARKKAAKCGICLAQSHCGSCNALRCLLREEIEKQNAA